MLSNLEKFSLPEIEEKVLKFWQENQIFEKSLKKNKVVAADSNSKKKLKKFVFFEGPPTANGRPGIHHVLSRSFKDIILRYKTMCGFFVPRQAGWDTHGLPVEIEVEKELGLQSKKDIEKYGIAAFNQKCRESVWRYKTEWEKLTERIGFWLDLKNPYITYQNSYIEVLWWIISQIAKKKLLYKGHKVVPWCSRCGTALSSHELALGYKEVKEQSVYIKFRLKSSSNNKRFKNTYILSWTTTPWTLPGNIALAVNPKADYVKVRFGGEFYILAKECLSIIDGDYSIVESYKGRDLVGLSYLPLFSIDKLKDKNSYKIYPADFVTTSEGTGIVHTAVMYGEDDYQLGKKFNLLQYHTVDEQGRFTKDVVGFYGLYVKDRKTEEKIINYLKSKNFLFKTELYAHDYPFCWRCSTPLLYYARDAWFVAMSKLRKKLLEENERINWIPSYLKHGRFGEWLKEIKDWNFSRERYWGTPLPVWVCSNCSYQKVISGVAELERELGGTKNSYILVRHGESESNVKKIISCWPEKQKMHLTLNGIKEVELQARKLKKQFKKIDFIFASDLTRTKETAEIISQEFGGVKIIFDKRLREVNFGVFQGRKNIEYHLNFSSDIEKFSKPVVGGESLRDVAKRVFEFIEELERKFKGKTFIIVSHEYTIWMLESVMRGWDEEKAVIEKNKRKGDFVKTGEAIKVELRKIPRNEYGFMDLHRPYIDRVFLSCPKCGSKMVRVKEIVDVWFDSGAMPFASGADYPADYIAEGVDQTRGWFYTLLAVGVLLDKGRPYKNVISLGHVLDKNGQKMSKSKGNVVDPWQMINRYGTDAIRWYFYTINSPGEPKKFNETDLAKVLRQFILLIYNSFVFFDIYAKKTPFINIQPKVSNFLDKWILLRLNETISRVTLYLDSYNIAEAAKTIEEFVSDLSRWYIRRSRKRFSIIVKSDKKELGTKQDYLSASQTLGYIFFNLSKLIAPFMPFFAEALYKSLVKNRFSLSVHLENWPDFDLKLKTEDLKLLKEMAEIRRLASLVLAKRAEAKIKIRQPLQKLKIKKSKTDLRKEILEILKEEVNVKEIELDPKLEEEVWLDTVLTHELREEGWLRELVRLVQDLRQEGKLKPKDKIVLMVELPQELDYLFHKNEKFIKREVNAKIIEYRRSTKFDIELETELDKWPIWLALRKV